MRGDLFGVLDREFWSVSTSCVNPGRVFYVSVSDISVMSIRRLLSADKCTEAG